MNGIMQWSIQGILKLNSDKSPCSIVDNTVFYTIYKLGNSSSKCAFFGRFFKKRCIVYDLSSMTPFMHVSISYFSRLKNILLFIHVHFCATHVILVAHLSMINIYYTECCYEDWCLDVLYKFLLSTYFMSI